MCTPQCIFEKLGGLAFDEAFRTGKYVVRYAKNLKNLQDEMRDLDDRREDIESKVCEASDRGEDIKVEVKNWQTKVDELKEDVVRLMGQSTARENMRCITCSCPNIRWRYKLSKQAEENIVKANKLTNTRFEEISRPKPRPPEFESLSDNNYVNFDSRASILKYLTDALKDSNVNMIGVYGLGGVGKTTLVKEVGDQMRQDGTFKQVAIAAVSKDLNVKEVQSKLAESLNLKLKATTDDQEGRRTELWNKFKNGDKYLVILDDIWEMVDLKKIGIPISDGKTGCKVVLTSRKEDLLRITMKVDRNFRIAELLEAEAWDLFKKKVGNSIESQPEIYPLACELCKKCNGLPLAINALGTALQDKPEYTWKNASDKVKRYMLTQIEGIDPGVIATLRVSYDMLRSSDAQSCFLLCCLFAEDAEIPIDELTRHCVARCLLALNPRTLDEARNAVCTVVDVLKSASLLTTGSHENVVKIHDVIRDVGISISRDEKAFLIDHGALRWPQNPSNGPLYSTISLNFKNIKELPDGLVYPQLYTLMVDSSELSDLEVPNNFFNGMTQLTVLSFTKMRMRRLPSSLAKLRNLRMLNLNGCELADIAILKDMKSNLEVLSLRGSSIKALPPEIAQLTNLRLLDLRGCSRLIEIPQGIISNLTNLEELLFPENFDQWEAIIDKKKEGTNSSSKNMGLEELRQSLDNGQLTTLHIFIPNVMLLPKDGLKFENLKRFRISVGSNFEWDEKFSGTRVLKYEGSSLRNGFIPLVDKAEALSLIGITGLKKTLHDRGVGNGFPDLRYLKVESCDDDLEYFLGEPKSSMQSHRLHPLQSFNKLNRLVIGKYKLRFLFTPTAARELVHLEQLAVRSCEIMEAIVGFEGQNELIGDVKFSKLKELVLQKLPNLISFYAEKEKTQTTTGSSSAHPQPLFSNKVMLPVLEILHVEALDSIEEIWDNQSLSVNQETVSFGQLRSMAVRRCKKLMNLVPSNILPRLRNLQFLAVEDCPNVEFIVFKNKNGEEEAVDDSTLIIPRLSRLWIKNIEKLKSFYSSSTTSNAQSLFNHQVAFPVLEDIRIRDVPMITRIWVQQQLSKPEKEVESFCKLKSIEVWRCNQLEYVLPSYMLPQLLNLLELKVEGCKKLEVIVSNKLKEKEATNNDIIVFPQLKTLALDDLDNLKCFCTGTDQLLFSHKVAFPTLEHLTITKVPKIKEIWDKQPLSEAEKEAISFSNLRRIDVQHCDQLVYVFSNKVILPVLEELKVEALNSIEEIWDKQSPSVNQETESFGQLRNIEVKGCKKLMNLVPSNILPRLRNLQFLKVDGCPNVEFVVFKNKKGEEEAADDSTLIIPQLRDLQIWKMEKLKSFYSSSTTSNAQSLFNHQVWGAYVLKTAQSFVMDGGASSKNERVYSVILPVLEELKVEALNSIGEIWDKQSPSVNQETESFGQLRNIEVKGCKKLMNLVPSNILPRLRNLQFLKVEDCPNVEFVVFKNKKGEEEAADDSTLIIPQLRDLQIQKMENLKSFYSSSTTSNAQSLFNHQVAFPTLEDLLIRQVPMITRIWVQQPLLKPEKEVESFCKLKSIQVWHCDQLEYVLPSYMLPQLHNLLQLDIAGCKELEVIVSKKLKEKEATNNDILVFPQLKTLKLSGLDNLKCFCTGTDQLLFSHKVAFPALEDLQIFVMRGNITEIWEKKPLPEPEQEIESFNKLATIHIAGCDQLVYVLPSYMLPRLQNLRRLMIGNCKEVEVIVSKELMNEKEAVDNDPIVFSQLKKVEFNDLPKLKSFYTGTELFSKKVAFPVLGHLTIRGLLEVKEIWDKQPVPEPENKAKCFYKLMSIHVEDCNQLVHVFPSYMLPQLQNLQKLVIANCKEMEVIISNKPEEKEATNNHIILFAELKTVILQILPNLKRVSPSHATSVYDLLFSILSNSFFTVSSYILLLAPCKQIWCLLALRHRVSNPATHWRSPMSKLSSNFNGAASDDENAFPMLEVNTIEVAIKDLRLWFMTPNTSSIDPDLTFLVNGTSRKEVATEESGTSSKVEDNNDHNKEEEVDGEEDVKNADDNNEGGRGGGGGEEKDDGGGGGGGD
ncbi:hypothetical protein Vadar_018938 [Vaccinium darrowii]|uniref:Uncharacterized protein n=1 Tax=Vaccinium darrowii TaxID=229202 RepID=A0ACB7YMQ4_9ERIC|nr:hypothetical protein Vadar_018938 [Vaccinium darrowii]